jgi:hypothetical protein
MFITNDNPGTFGTTELDWLMRHESGHIFGAADELTSWPDCPDSAACTQPFGYLGGDNGTCDMSCAINISCVMRDGTDDLCDFTRIHIGWLDSDQDGIPDPLDTTPTLTISTFPANPATTPALFYDALAEDIPLPTNHPDFSDVTINDVRVEYNLINQGNGSSSGWLPAAAGDGRWDSSYEEDFSILICEDGNYIVQLRAVNEVNNTSSLIQHSITVSLNQSCKLSYLPIVLLTNSNVAAESESESSTIPSGYPPPLVGYP